MNEPVEDAEVVRVTRRSLLAALGLSVGGLALGLAPRAGRADEPTGWAAPRLEAASPAEEARLPGLNPNVFVHIAPNGQVTLVCARSEMGQGVRSSIPVLLADELGADPRRIDVVQADGDHKFGDQNTDGSSSIRMFYDDLRQVAAVARVMLVTAAARRWRVTPKTCTTREGLVIHVPTQRTLAFAEVVEAASKLPIPRPSLALLRPEAELTQVLGDAIPVLDGPAIVNGTAVYGADRKLPNMLVAVIARPPVVGGTVVRFDPAPALAIDGVKRVIEMPAPVPPWNFQVWGGVAVLAENTWAALKGRAALAIQWDPGANASYDSALYRDELLASADGPGTPLRVVGDTEAALKIATRLVEADYYVPHLAQLPMEPPAALANVADGRCEVWASTQNPQAARTNVAEMLGMKEADVTVHVTLLGGAFGRKSKADFVREAAFLSATAGVPVRVQWTREDDVHHSYYNTVNAQHLRAGLDAGGKVTAWEQHTAFPPIGSTFALDADRPTANDLQQGVLDWPLDIPNIRAEACPAKAHVRIGWYRSVYNIFHAFAMGSFIDEIAHARGKDPRENLLEIIGPPRALGLAELGVDELANYSQPLDLYPVDAGRLRNVVERVTASADWDQRVANGRSLGLAAHRSFLSYTAVVVSVVRDERRKIRVDEAWIAMDPGIVVNGDRVRAQMEGAVIMGISNALFGGITMKAGMTVQSNFNDARICRIGDAPRQIHVDLVPGKARAGGVGEPGVPPVSAAVANAMFALTGERVRMLPLVAAG